MPPSRCHAPRGAVLAVLLLSVVGCGFFNPFRPPVQITDGYFYLNQRKYRRARAEDAVLFRLGYFDRTGINGFVPLIPLDGFVGSFQATEVIAEGLEEKVGQLLFETDSSRFPVTLTANHAGHKEYQFALRKITVASRIELANFMTASETVTAAIDRALAAGYVLDELGVIGSTFVVADTHREARSSTTSATISGTIAVHNGHISLTASDSTQQQQAVKFSSGTTLAYEFEKLFLKRSSDGIPVKENDRYVILLPYPYPPTRWTFE
jgi:hypothetical protein